MRAIGFLHTARVHVATFDALLAAADPSAKGSHVVDESLLADARAIGVDEALRARIARHLATLAAEVDAILCTCSTISGPAEEIGRSISVPVIRIDRPMAREAVRRGHRIGVVAAVDSTMAPTLALLSEEAGAAGVTPRLVPLPCFEAWPHFEAGDIDTFLEAVAAHVDAVAGRVDVVVLAQASMAAAAARCTTGCPILSSPVPGITAALEAGSA